MWERPPGLIQHVLTVLVFWSWVLLRPRLSPSPRSLKLFHWSSALPHGPLDICLDLLPAAPRPPMQKRDAQHMFLQHRGARAERRLWRPKCLAGKVFRQISRRCWQVPHRLSGNTKRYHCQGLGIFRQHEMLSLPRFGHFPAARNAITAKVWAFFRQGRNAVTAKVWALSGKENGCWKIGPAFGNAAGFSALRPPQPSTELLWS